MTDPPPGAQPTYDQLRDEALRILPALFRNPLIGRGLACAGCAAPVHPYEEVCGTCLGQRRGWGDQLADIVVPLTYAGPQNAQARQDLWLYKYSEHAEVRRLAHNRLIYLVWYALTHHAACLEAIRGPVSAVTSVPSGRQTGREGGHPLEALVFYPHPHRRVHLVRVRDAPARVIDPDSLQVVGDVAGAHVLVIDDTWTTGASTQSAAIALRRAGASQVSVLTIGRWLKPDWGATPQFLRGRPADERWSPDVCPVTRGACPPTS